MNKTITFLLSFLFLSIVYGRMSSVFHGEDKYSDLGEIDFDDIDEFLDFLDHEFETEKSFVLSHDSDHKCAICKDYIKENIIEVCGKTIKHNITNDKNDMTTHFFSRD